MRRFRSPRDDAPPAPALTAALLLSDSNRRSQSSSPHSPRSVIAQLHEDSEWSPPLDRKLVKDMPSLPRRYLPFWSKTPKTVDPEQHTVWLFDNTAFRLDNTPDTASKFSHQKANHSFIDSVLNDKQPPQPPVWQVEYVAAYFGEKMDHDPDEVARAVLDKLDLAHDDGALATVQQRLEPFLTPILSGATVRVKINDVETQSLGPASAFGISSSVNRFHFEPSANHAVTTIAAATTIVSATTPASRDTTISPTSFLLPSSTTMAEPYGWAVISGIDDTIKVTHKSSALSVLRSTFLDEPLAVSGMPALYNHIDGLLSSPAWFYLSASPYLLYSHLRAFRSTYYPFGTLILRDASWQNLAGLMASLTTGVQEYRINRLMKIRGWFPKRSVVCFGNDGGKDAEAYGEVGRRFPGWIKAVFIRRVGEDGSKKEEPAQRKKVEEERFKNAFEGTKVQWYVFDNPDEVIGRINEILTTKFLPERVVEL